MAQTLDIVDYPSYGEEWVRVQQALKANRTILAGPGCKYTSVQDAVNAAVSTHGELLPGPVESALVAITGNLNEGDTIRVWLAAGHVTDLVLEVDSDFEVAPENMPLYVPSVPAPPADVAAGLAEAVSYAILEITATDNLDGTVRLEAATGAEMRWRVVPGAGLPVTVTETYGPGGPIARPYDPTVRVGRIEIEPGEYDEDVVIPAPMDIVAKQPVTITGAWTALVDGVYYDGLPELESLTTRRDSKRYVPYRFYARRRPGALFAGSDDAQILNVDNYGHITGPDGRPIVAARAANIEGTPGTIMDCPLPRPRYTDANAIFCLVCDDCNADLVRVRDSGPLAGYSNISYMIAKRVPASLGVISDGLSNSGLMSAQQIKDFVLQAGGEVLCHTKTHGGNYGIQPYSDERDRGYAEIVQAQEAIEAATGYPVRGFLFNGGNVYDPSATPGTLTAMLMRQRMLIQRSINVHEWAYTFPVPNRYPSYMCGGTWQGITDPNGSKIFRRILGNLAYSRGLAYTFFTHSSAEPLNSNRITDAQFKLIVDLLSQYRDAGLIDLVPFSMFPYIQPTYRPSGIINGGFEFSDGEDTGFDFEWMAQALGKYWLVHTGMTTGVGNSITSSTEEAKSGSRSCKIVRTSGTCGLRYYGIAVCPGEAYKLEWWQKCAAGGTVTATLTWNVTGGSPITVSRDFSSVGTSWEYQCWSCMIPKNCYSMHVYLDPGIGTFYLDDIRLV